MLLCCVYTQILIVINQMCLDAYLLQFTCKFRYANMFMHIHTYIYIYALEANKAGHILSKWQAKVFYTYILI